MRPCAGALEVDNQAMLVRRPDNVDLGVIGWFADRAWPPGPRGLRMYGALQLGRRWGVSTVAWPGWHFRSHVDAGEVDWGGPPVAAALAGLRLRQPATPRVRVVGPAVPASGVAPSTRRIPREGVGGVTAVNSG